MPFHYELIPNPNPRIFIYFTLNFRSMVTLEELLNIGGVAAAGEFTPDGKLVDYKERMNMSKEMVEMSAQFCATVSMMFNTLAGAFTQLTKTQWIPQKIWTYTGGEWTVIIAGGTKGVFAETAKTDINQVIKALMS